MTTSRIRVTGFGDEITESRFSHHGTLAQMLSLAEAYGRDEEKRERMAAGVEETRQRISDGKPV